MSVFDWIQMAKTLDADGLEMYDGFFTSLDGAYLDSVGEAIRSAGFAMPMLCCSPDFTQPDPAARRRAVEHHVELIRVTRRLGGARSVCRVLSGQRRPEVRMEEGVAWVVECIQQLLPVAREYDVVLGMENHYKDGFWKFPEFAQKKDVFLKIVEAIPDREYFGVQYDPSNAIVVGDDPIELLEAVQDRVVSMHASDRWLNDGATIEELRQSDGTLGYSPKLKHGVVGKGLNDYPKIFNLLAKNQYSGWISIEDGMNGMEEGVAWVVECIQQLLPVAREHDVVLGMENHYKDGFWKYPEFAQKKEVFLKVIEAIPDREYFGVQYDPSNAIVAGDDPIELLEAVQDRVVSMHASDRWLSDGATIEDLRQNDGTLGYSPKLKHGVVGKGLNDYPKIFNLLAKNQYSGWISIEDGMNGMEEMAASLAFLRKMVDQYFGDHAVPLQ